MRACLLVCGSLLVSQMAQWPIFSLLAYLLTCLPDAAGNQVWREPSYCLSDGLLSQASDIVTTDAV